MLLVLSIVAGFEVFTSLAVRLVVPSVELPDEVSELTEVGFLGIKLLPEFSLLLVLSIAEGFEVLITLGVFPVELLTPELVVGVNVVFGAVTPLSLVTVRNPVEATPLPPVDSSLTLV